MSHPKSKPRLLLTGASGFLGFNIGKQAKEKYQVLGTVNSNPYPVSQGIQQVKLDITDLTALRNLVRESHPNAIIHTAAISNINTCQQNPTETALLNVKTAIYLAQLAAELSIPFVFTSTDLVFDGVQGNYTETDAVNPINHYGEQKVKAEEGIRRAYPEAAICRMPLMYGVGGPGSKNFFLPLLAKIKANEKIGLFTDEYRSMLGATSAAAGLLLALDLFKGTYHLGGNERLTRYNLGLLMAKELQMEEHSITAIKQADVPMAAPRPKDVTLNNQKAVAQGFAPANNQCEIAQVIAAL